MDGESVVMMCGVCEKVCVRYVCLKCGVRLCVLVCYE